MHFESDRKGFGSTSTGGKERDNSKRIQLDCISPSTGSYSVPSTRTSTPTVPTGDHPQLATALIRMRCLILNQETQILNGINDIADITGASVTVEGISRDDQRFVSVSGTVYTVSKAFGLIARRINGEPPCLPSGAGSSPVAIRLIIPDSFMGLMIGKAASKIQELRQASGAQLHATRDVVPGTTERLVIVVGVPDAIHLAIYNIAKLLIEQKERVLSPSKPRHRPDSHRSKVHRILAYIPGNLVGAIIGKGGSKINEIMQKSSCQVRILERSSESMIDHRSGDERLVLITGHSENIQSALGLLYDYVDALEIANEKQLRSKSFLTLELTRPR